ncbi:MAG: hypothetical protein F6K42_14320 [Leptolyngbya sp. SIO1D8]|nr:hypothetical protein [Leptolyngbya sp. SIO1D8]
MYSVGTHSPDASENLDPGNLPTRLVSNVQRYMTIRLASFLVMFWNSLAVTVALVIYNHGGKDHFGESGFITLLSTLQLLAIALLADKILQARKPEQKEPLWKQPYAVWRIISFSFIFLAADEYLSIHEVLDLLIHDIFDWQETGLTDRIDDLIVGLYGIVGIGTLFIYRGELKPYRKSFPLFTWGFALLFCMVGLDTLTNEKDFLELFFEHNLADTIYIWLIHLEDSLKVFAEAFFILAFYSILQGVKRIPEQTIYPPKEKTSALGYSKYFKH